MTVFRTFRWFLIGVVIAIVLTVSTYHLHPDPTGIGPLLYLMVFPSSLAFMSAEHATPLAHVIIAIVAIAANGALYWFGSVVGKKILLG
jgi:hypothetical protein